MEIGSSAVASGPRDSPADRSPRISCSPPQSPFARWNAHFVVHKWNRSEMTHVAACEVSAAKQQHSFGSRSFLCLSACSSSAYSCRSSHPPSPYLPPSQHSSSIPTPSTHDVVLRLFLQQRRSADHRFSSLQAAPFRPHGQSSLSEATAGAGRQGTLECGVERVRTEGLHFRRSGQEASSQQAESFACT
jgi:hypothetical protein